MAVNFYFERQTRLNSRRALKSFIESIFKKEGRDLADISYVFCTDEYLLDINKRFLNHDYYTDIITFELNLKKRNPTIGEIYISIDRVKENAGIHNNKLVDELHRVIFHGALHLCGYKDLSKSQKKAMRSKEDFYLNKYGQLLR
ncbi:rRNA maturation RNase YbeY [soil metagenome]